MISSTQKDRKLSSFESGAAGAVSSFFTRAILQPFDVLKIRFQVSFTLI